MSLLTSCLPLLALALSSPLLPAAAQDLDRKESPFDGLRWEEGAPEVLVGEVWYRPVSIGDVPVEEILTFCGERWPGKRQKRFGEDLVEAMTLMGSAPPAAVDLTLIRLGDGERVVLEGVPMTATKRKAIRDAAKSSPGGKRPPRAPSTVERAQALGDLEYLAERLEEQFAYLHLKGLDLAAELEHLRARIPDPVATAWLADRVDQFMNRFGDGHAGASSSLQERSTLFPPALLFQAGDTVVAVRPDRSGFLDPDRPYVVAIDGEPLDAWIDALRPRITAGSPQLVRTRALRDLRELQVLRRWRGLLEKNVVEYSLAAEPDSRRVARKNFEMSSRRPTYGVWPRGWTRDFPGNIGYMRLDRMDDERIPDLHAAMARYRKTHGLIIDVRGNGGGSRGLLLALAGYLVGPDEGPWVGNVAAYRLSAAFPEDHLEARFMRRADDPRWSPEQRAAIEALAADFEPEWTLPDGFSAWHYLVLDRTGAEGEYFYDRPVVVLSDASCFSATDIFLGALAEHPRVTLLGEASAGGSARSQGFTLPASGIEVRCASMASFRPDGRLYDGRGVEVDVAVPAAPTDFLVGGTDERLEAALERLRR